MLPCRPQWRACQLTAAERRVPRAAAVDLRQCHQRRPHPRALPEPECGPTRDAHLHRAGGRSGAHGGRSHARADHPDGGQHAGG